MISTDRITLPASLIEDARAHPEKYRPEVDLDDTVLALTDRGVPVEKIGTVSYIDGDNHCIGLDLPDDGSEMATTWLCVGGVEQGPRPEVDGRVIVLRWCNGNVDPAVCTVTGGDERDDVHPKSIQVREDGTGVAIGDGVFGPVYYATEWALLPAEDDGMGEATAGRTVGSLSADDIGRWIEIETSDERLDRMNHGVIISISHRRTLRRNQPKTAVTVSTEQDLMNFHEWAPDTPCKVSDGPGETT